MLHMEKRGRGTGAATAVLLVWLAAAAAVGLSGVLGKLHGPWLQVILIALTVVSIALWKLWKSAGKLVSGLSVDVLVAFHLPRLLIGGAFLALMYAGKLPRSFAMPAGIGDVVVGVLCVVGLLARPRLRRRRVLWWWNVLGLLDILAVVVEGLVAGMHDPESMGLMAKFPLSMLPTWYVPLVIVTHLVLFGRLKRSSWATAKSPML